MLSELIIFICVLYIIRLLAKMFLPMLFSSMVNKATQQGQQRNYQQTNPREGSIKVDFIPEGKKSRVPDSEGDFIDYEEIK